MTAPTFGRPVPPTFGVPASGRTVTLEAPAWMPRDNPAEVPTIGAQLGMDGTELARSAPAAIVDLWSNEGEQR